MVNTSRINEDDPRLFGLLGPDQQFVVEVDSNKEWADRLHPVQANLVLVTEGTLEFWSVVDNVWHPVTAFAPGHWSSYRVAARHDPAPPSAPLDPADVARAAVDERKQIREGLKRGEYPEIGDVPAPKKLKDIWEGKGDPNDSGPSADLDSWPRNGTQEEIDSWVAEQSRKEAERAQQLRVEADAERDQSIALPEYLRDEETPLPHPDYTSYNLPRTDFIGSDGQSVIRRG